MVHDLLTCYRDLIRVAHLQAQQVQHLCAGILLHVHSCVYTYLFLHMYKKLLSLYCITMYCFFSSTIFVTVAWEHSMQWVPVTTAWRVLRLRIEERPPIRRAAANKLNKQSRTSDEGWSSSLGVGRGANNPSLLKTKFSNTHMRDDSSGHKTIRR